MSIRKVVLTIILIILAAKYSWDYITSEDFQKYADKTKAPWTCQVNMILGGMYDVMSEYNSSYAMFDRVINRCPNLPVAGDALFRKADALESLSRMQDALPVYYEYVEKYPDGKNIRIAQKAIDRIRFSR